MDWSQTALQPDFLVGVFWGFYRMPEEKRNWPGIKAALGRCAVDFDPVRRIARPLLRLSAFTSSSECRRP
jgi:glutathione S-transferase